MNTFMYLSFNDIVLPVWMFVSQWMLLFALGGLVIIAYRQLGSTLLLKDRGTEREGIQVGEQASAFSYTLARQGETLSRSFDPQGKWSILLFADPGCVSCRNALVALERLVTEGIITGQVLVLTSAQVSVVDAVEEFKVTPLDVGSVDEDVLHKRYRTYGVPFMYIIDTEGAVRAKGVVETEHEMRKLVRKVDRSIVQVVVPQRG